MFRFILLTTTLVACGGSSEPDATPASSQHAGAHAVPGSHDDWCGEHAVPESQCTRCNSALVPAFKATGDWCGEHGLPESQCLVCNPDLVIERPPKEG
ncbi:MAG: hypothetical protein ACI9K2_007238 [Myxococcota bacterium]|jgi:hypothetical protein